MDAAKHDADATSPVTGRQQRHRQQSWLFAPKAIVVLDTTDILNQSHHRGAGGADIIPILAEGGLDENCGVSSIASTVAYPVGLLNITSTPLSRSPHLVETGESMPVGHLRPEFIYVKVIKDTPSSPLGIVLRRRMDHVCITWVKEEGVLGRCGKTLVRPGDRILAINGVSCIRFTAMKVAKLIRNAQETISLVIWNKDGDPNLVSCTVQKPAVESKVGVCIKNDHGAVRVSRVHPDGLFAGSLLLPGHRCIQINGVRTDGLRSKDAASMISLCNHFVTIVSRPKQESAMVLSCEVHSNWWRSVYSMFYVRPVSVVTSHSLHV